MKVKLTTNDMWSPVLQLTLENLPVVIGRNGKSDVTIDDVWISDQHCQLSEVGGQLNVRDLHSEHGTLINGQTVSESTLLPGDTLTLGIRSFRVSYRRSRQALDASNGKPQRKPTGTTELVRASE